MQINALLGVALKGHVSATYDGCLWSMYLQLADIESDFILCNGEIKVEKSIHVVYVLFYMYCSFQYVSDTWWI
jgi:hypothetical protein